MIFLLLSFSLYFVSQRLFISCQFLGVCSVDYCLSCFLFVCRKVFWFRLSQCMLSFDIQGLHLSFLLYHLLDSFLCNFIDKCLFLCFSNTYFAHKFLSLIFVFNYLNLALGIARLQDFCLGLSLCLSNALGHFLRLDLGLVSQLGQTFDFLFLFLEQKCFVVEMSLLF